MKKFLALIVVSTAIITGCATPRSNNVNVDALNARIAALEGQLASKDDEILGLQRQVNDESMARQAAESALRSTPAPAAKKTVQSDLK